MKHLLHLILATALVSSFTHRVEADEPQPVHRFSDDRLPTPDARLNLALLGTAVTVGFYGASLGASYLWPEVRGAEDLRIPVAGPWMAVGRTRLCSQDQDATASCNDATRIIGAVLFALDGLGQAGGLALLAQSIFMRTSPSSTDASHQGWTAEARSAQWRARMASQTHHTKIPLSYSSGDFQVTARPMQFAGADIGFGVFGKF